MPRTGQAHRAMADALAERERWQAACDLAAAERAGLKIAHIARPDESGPGKGEAGPLVRVDFAARDLAHLAELLSS